MRDAAQFFKVLADEARLQILWLLFNHRELCVCDLMQVLGSTQSKTSRHLSTLRHAGLVTDRKEGLWSYYALRPAKEELSRRHLEALRASLGKRPDAVALLAKLEAWLRAKNGRAACVEGEACASSGKPSARARQTRPAGGSR